MQQLAAGRQPGAVNRIGKYEIVRKLGDGATSTVYLGRDPFANRDVAITRHAGSFTGYGATPTFCSQAACFRVSTACSAEHRRGPRSPVSLQGRS